MAKHNSIKFDSIRLSKLSNKCEMNLHLKKMNTNMYLWMNNRTPEKVILRRVQAFYLITIMETAQESKKVFTESLMLYTFLLQEE